MRAVETITVQGFKSLASPDPIRLESVNVIIGSNGSGKSNFIQVFSFLNELRMGHLKEFVATSGGANSLLHFGAKFTSSINVKLVFENETNGYEVKLAPTAEETLAVVYESVSYWNKAYPKPYTDTLVGRSGEAGISLPQARGIAHYVQSNLERWRLYHFHDTSRASPMKQTCDIDDNLYLRRDGSNLSAFLYMLQEVQPSSYQMIRATVQNVAPFFDDFLLVPSRLNEGKVRLNWKHKGTDAFFGPDALSDGTLRFIALATLFLQPVELRPSLILVDEPELGLHPFALTSLASLIKSAAAVTQVVVSTQSAQLLDNFSPDDVLVADRIYNRTCFSRLKASELSDWLSDYSLGELWEKAEIGGRPSGHGGF